jgi:hypothetical protein
MAKEGSGIKLTIWLLTTKSREWPWFPYVEVACDISLKSSRQPLNLCFRPHFNQRSSHKVMGPKVVRVLTMGISKLPFGSPSTKWHLGVGPGPMAKHRVYYKGEGGGFPQVQAVVSLVSLSLPMARPCTKVLQLRTNQLVVWFVQVRVSDSSAYQSS